MELANNKISALEQKIENLQKKKRTEQRKLRDEQRKLDQRRYYIVGEMVIKHFPELKEIIPGSKTENDERFSGFEIILQAISSDEKISDLFHKFVQRKPDNCGDV